MGKKKYKDCKVGDYVMFIEHPYEIESEGSVFGVIDESMVKVACIDGSDQYVSTSDITHIIRH